MASGGTLPSRVFHAMNTVMTRRHALFAALCLGLAACDSSDTTALPLNLYECDAGEAALRHLIAQQISRDGMTPASDGFTARFADLKLQFVNAFNLKDVPPDHIIADPETRLAAFVLQLRKLRQTSATTWQAEVGWSYKKEFARLKLRLETKDGKTSVVEAVKEGEP